MNEEIAQQEADSVGLRERLDAFYRGSVDFDLQSGDTITLRVPTQEQALRAMFAARDKYPDQWEKAMESDPADAGIDMATADPEKREVYLATMAVTLAAAAESLRVCCPELADAGDDLLKAIVQSEGGATGNLARACDSLCGNVLPTPGRESDPLDSPSDSG